MWPTLRCAIKKYSYRVKWFVLIIHIQSYVDRGLCSLDKVLCILDNSIFVLLNFDICVMWKEMLVELYIMNCHMTILDVSV